jgi:hypothetical protein
VASYWDRAKGYLSDILGTYTSGASSLAGGMVQSRVAVASPELAKGLNNYREDTRKQLQIEARRLVDKSPLTRLAEVTLVDDAFNLGIEKIDQFHQATYPKVARVASTAMLTGADAVAGRELSLLENWNDAKNISPGQAFWASQSEVFDLIGLTDAAKEKGVDLPTFLDPNFNVADPDQRKKAFDDELVGKIFSGGIDGFFNWYGDPAVVLGYAAAKGIKLGLNRPIESAEDVIRLRSELDNHGLFVKSNGAMGQKTPMGMVAERLVGKNTAEAFDDIFIRRSTNRTLMASLVGEAKTYDDVADIIGAAAGDLTSMRKLEASKASVADDIKMNSQLLDDFTARYANIPWGKAAETDKYLPTIEEYDRLGKVLQDLRRRDRNLDRALSEGIGDLRLIDDFTSAADVTILGRNIGNSIEAARAKRSAFRHNVGFFVDTFRISPFSRAVKVISLPFNKLPRGVVAVDGGQVASSANEIKFALNSEKVLRRPEYLEVKEQLFANYANARNATERMNAVKKVEQEVAEIIALEMGFSLEEALGHWNQFSKMRTGILDDVSKHGFWIDDNGDLVTSPFWKTEMPNVVPMMDFRSYRKALQAIKAFQDIPLGAAQGEIPQAIRGLAGGAMDAADFLNATFKVSVLTRMGYPIRNTIDGQLRAFLVLEAMAKTDDFMKNFGQNAVTRAKKARNFLEETLAVRNPLQLRTKMGKIVTERQGLVDARNSVLDELTPQKYYAGASGTFGEKVDPALVELSISSKSKPLFGESKAGIKKRDDYFRLRELKKKQNGLLFGEDLKRYRSLEEQAYNTYVRQEVVPNLPAGTTIVYADFTSNRIFYNIPKRRKTLPKEAFPGVQPRKGLPEGALEQPIESVGPFKLRGKAPSAQPDIRVITSYEVSRANLYDDIKDIIGEDQMRRITVWAKSIENLDQQMMDAVQQSIELAQRRAELKIVRAGEKPETMLAPDGTPVTFQGAFEGPAGAVTRAEASSESTLNWLTERQAYLAFDGKKGSSSIIGGRPVTLSSEATKVSPTDPQYFNEMAVYANKFLRPDQLAMRILQGQGDTEIATWLRSQGKFYLREINADFKSDEIMDHIATARSRVYKVFPDQQIRSLIAREELSPEQFDVLMRGNPALADIPGRALAEKDFGYGTAPLRTFFSRRYSDIFKLIGSTPEDNLVAWPFYNKLYLRSLDKQLKIQSGMGKNVQNPDLIIQMQRSAHAEALKITNETLYRIGNNTGAANFLRFLVPFFNAQYNAVSVYGRLLTQKPQRIARASLLWNSPNQVATVVDEEGRVVPPGAGPEVQQYLLFTIPESMRKSFGIPEGYDISVPKNSLNVFITGENPLAPSFGLPVQIPVSAFANRHPDTLEDIKTFLSKFVGETGTNVIMTQLLPFGRAVPEPIRLLLPAWGQKAYARSQGLDDAGYANAIASAMKTLDFEWKQNGSVGPRPTYKQAEKLADQLFDIRIAANLTLPFAFSFRPKWVPIIEDARRAIQDPKIGPSGLNDYLLAKWGDSGYFATAPTTKSITGVRATVGAVRNQKEYNKLIVKLDDTNTPGLIGFIVNFGTSQDKYSDAAANYFRGREIQPGGETKYNERRPTKDIINDREESLGWLKYEKLRQKYDVILKDLSKQVPVSSLDSKIAKQLGLDKEFEQEEEALKAMYPAWAKAKELGQGDFSKTKRYVMGLLEILRDKKWMRDHGDTPAAQTLTDYVLKRDYLARKLQESESVFGRRLSINDPYHAELKTNWENFILDSKLKSPEFSDLYSRYLENDNYEVIE